MHYRSSLSLILLAAAATVACSDNSGPPEPVPVTVRFDARAGAATFRCGTSYPGIGTTASTITPADFKLYLHNIRLVRADGTEEPVTLTQDQTWQLDDIAMLDFEDATGSCTNGTAAMRMQVDGTVLEGDYTGIKFILGLPFSRNHADVATAPAPLNQSRMFWNWNAGYKFLRLDVNSTGRASGWFVHIGSTGCNGTGPTAAPTSCAQPNRAEIALSGFDAARNTIVLDVAQYLSASNVDVDGGGPSGCMSGTTDPECEQILPRLGLAWNTTPAAPQALFRVQ